MNDQGKLTPFTVLLILGGLGMALAGGILAPDTLPTALLGGAWWATFLALNNVYRKVREKIREREIREEERRGVR